MDSRAAEHVIPPRWVQFVTIQAYLRSIADAHYTANGQRIANQGEQLISLMIARGQRVGLTFQVAKFNKPWILASKLLSKGCRSVFDEDECYMLNKTAREAIETTRERGVCVANAFLD